LHFTRARGAAADRLRHLESRLRPDFRRSIIFGLLALGALIAGHQLGGMHAASMRQRAGVLACAAGVGVFGTWSARVTGNEIARLARARAGAGPAASLRIGVLLGGSLVAVAAVLDLLAVPVHYLVGGTVLALIFGVAAQQVLGTLFAGLVLLFARPYVPGQYIRIRSGSLGGPHEGTVTGVGLMYTEISGAEGRLNIPNSALLSAAVGEVPRPEAAAPADRSWLTDAEQTEVLQTSRSRP
jgi:small-conductance mechanosensitive channel